MFPGPCDLTELRSEGAAAGGCGGVRFSCPDSGQPVTAEAERAQGFPQVRPTFPVSGAAPDVRHEGFGSEEASREAQPARKEARCLVSCSVGARRAGSTAHAQTPREQSPASSHYLESRMLHGLVAQSSLLLHGGSSLRWSLLSATRSTCPLTTRYDGCSLWNDASDHEQHTQMSK